MHANDEIERYTLELIPCKYSSGALGTILRHSSELGILLIADLASVVILEKPLLL